MIQADFGAGPREAKAFLGPNPGKGMSSGDRDNLEGAGWWLGGQDSGQGWRLFGPDEGE